MTGESYQDHEDYSHDEAVRVIIEFLLACDAEGENSQVAQRGKSDVDAMETQAPSPEQWRMAWDEAMDRAVDDFAADRERAEHYRAKGTYEPPAADEAAIEDLAKQVDEHLKKRKEG